jgi:hypothetical protein
MHRNRINSAVFGKRRQNVHANDWKPGSLATRFLETGLRGPIAAGVSWRGNFGILPNLSGILPKREFLRWWSENVTNAPLGAFAKVEEAIAIRDFSRTF